MRPPYALLIVILFGLCAQAFPQAGCKKLSHLLSRSERTYLVAAESGCNVVTSDSPGYKRVIIDYERYSNGRIIRDPKGKKIPIHAYYDPHGKKMTKAEISDLLSRLSELKTTIPPAYDNVWIPADPNAHLVYVGEDESGKVQQRQHPDHKHRSSVHKYDSNVHFGMSLSRIREHAYHDIKHGSPKTKVVAGAALFMDSTLVRVGNDGSRKRFGRKGATNIGKDEIIRYGDGEIELDFIGKGGVRNDSSKPFPDELTPLFDRLMDLPGPNLFQYHDKDGYLVTISPADFNQYIDRITGQGFTAKNFRTWWGTVLAAEWLSFLPYPNNEREMTKNWNEARQMAATALNNKPTEAERSYIDPLIKDVYFSEPERIIALTDEPFAPGRPPKAEEKMEFIERKVLRLLMELRS